MEAGEIIARFISIWEHPLEQGRALRERGERPLAFFCSYAPEEIMHAAGFTPVRLMGAPRSISSADAHLQAYCCSVARTDLDMALEGELDWLEGAVFVQTCDTMMRLSDVWRLNTSFPFHADLSLPVRMGEGVSLPFLKGELTGFLRAVEGLIGQTVTLEALRESVAVYNRNRQLMEEVYRLRREHPGLLSGLQGTACAVAGLWMRKEEHNHLLESLLESVGEATPPGGGLTPLYVSGSVCTTPDLFDLARELEADFIDDDLCCGHRYYEGRVELDGGDVDVLEAIAERISGRINCPAKHSLTEDRADYLVERAQRCGARGVVFFLQNFCEPYLFDQPFLKQRLKDAGIPSLLLESDLQSFSRGQLRTRLQAFLETIRGI